MNVGITSAPLSIGVNIHAGHQPTAKDTTKEIEPASASSNNPQRSLLNKDSRSADEKPRPPDRPPGTDPSTTPQSLFNASLIASEYKASAVIEELAVKDVEQDEADRIERIAQSTEEADTRAEKTSNDAKVEKGEDR